MSVFVLSFTIMIFFLKKSSYYRCCSLLQLWTISLINELEMNYVCLLGLDGNRLHLPVRGDRRLFEQAGKLTQRSREKIKVCLHWDNSDPVCPYLSKFLLKCSQYIHSLRYVAFFHSYTSCSCWKNYSIFEHNPPCFNF